MERPRRLYKDACRRAVTLGSIVETKIQISRPAQVLTGGTRFAFRGNEIDLAFQTGGQLAVDDGDSLWTTTTEEEEEAAC